MRIRNIILAISPALIAAASANAQGVTTGAISGTVTNDQGRPIQGAQVVVINRETGARSIATTKANGGYYVPQLEVGSAYGVQTKFIGFAPHDTSGVTVSLGGNAVVNLQMSTASTQLAAVVSTASAAGAAANPVINPEHKGVAETVTDSSIARLPSLNRNFTDFLTVVPQISTKGPGNSGGGMNNRYNAIQIDGSIATDLFGLGSTGQPGGQANAKQAPLGAIKEYQVLLAPYDVRQGNFTGFLLNAVTKSGTNDVHGEAFGYYRDQNLERDVPFLRAQPFKQDQYGLSVGGPIIKDQLHYFLSAEFENKSTPASGPYFGQPASSSVAVPVTDSQFNTFTHILQSKYGYGDLGSTGSQNDLNPLSNVFGRIDYSGLPMNSRLVLRYNYAAGNIDVFPVSSSACNRSATSFCASGSGYTFDDKTNSEAAQLFTNFNNGSTNEFLASYTTIADVRAVSLNAPFVQVKGVFDSATGSSTTTLSAGTDNSSQGNTLNQRIVELTDNYNMQFGDHHVTVGTKDQFYHARDLFSQNSLGFYTFGNMDSLNLGLPDRVQIGAKLDNSDGSASFNAHMYGVYVQDDWQAMKNLSITAGLRLDMPGLDTKPGENLNIDTLLNINTANVPTTHVQAGPRVGFNWDVTSDQVNQLRGGTGIFVGQPAWVWLSNAYANSGVNAYATFTCSSPATAPAFPGVAGPIPTKCNGPGSTTPLLTVNTVNPNLSFPAAWRSSLGYDRKLPWNMVATVEGLYTKMVDQFFYQNLGLAAPLGTDAHGRVMYGQVSGATHTTLSPTYKLGLSDVINLTNESANKDYSYGLTGQLQKRFSDAFEGSIAYTYSRSYNQFDLTSSVAYSNWQFGRAYAGTQQDQILAPSKWDIPNRIVATGTYSFPTKTDVSFIYTAESGAPYSWVINGDINGDGSSNNDLMYIPTNAHDTTQIQFSTNGSGANAISPAAQQDSMEAFINRNPCIASQRGQIMARSSCRLPWTQEVDLSLRQSLPVTMRGQNVVLQIDAFNFLNLLNKNWGAQSTGSTNDPFILVKKSFNGGSNIDGGAASTSQALYNFSTNFNQTSKQNVASNYRLQAYLKFTF